MQTETIALAKGGIEMQGSMVRDQHDGYIEFMNSQTVPVLDFPHPNPPQSRECERRGTVSRLPFLGLEMKHPTQPYHQSVRLALNYIHEHCSEDLSLETVAREVYLSTSYFATLFKKCVGVSFVDYVTEFRMYLAKAMLRTEDVKICQVAESVGYSTNRYFVHVFKRRVGMLPSEYRDRVRGF